MTLAPVLQTETRMTLQADTASELMVPNPISLRAEASRLRSLLDGPGDGLQSDSDRLQLLWCGRSGW